MRTRGERRASAQPHRNPRGGVKTITKNANQGLVVEYVCIVYAVELKITGKDAYCTRDDERTFS